MARNFSKGLIRDLPFNHGCEIKVDPEDEWLLRDFKWHHTRLTNTLYAATSSGDVPFGVSRLLHRVILRPEPHEIVDHINRDGLDNRRSNLRIASRAVNSLNSVVYHNNTSGYRGVSFDKENGKWVARARHEGKYKNLGRYDSPEEASAAYVEHIRSSHPELEVDSLILTCSRDCRRTGGFKERKSWPVEELLKEMF